MRKKPTSALRTCLLTLTFAVFSFLTVTYTSCAVDKCKDVVCQNGGTCGEGNCTCVSGYSGTLCATADVTKFLGTYNGANTCGGSVVTIVVGSTPNTFHVPSTIGTGNCEKSFNIVGNMNGNNFTISQTVTDNCGNVYSISGNGSLAGNMLSVSLVYTSGSNTATCSYSGSK